MIENNDVINVVLVGNPNTGKTSLLNALTGMSLHVGNWPGKTIEKKEGVVEHKGSKIRIIDLPGTYSIAPYSEEEKISHDFLTSQKADIIVQIINVNSLERNLLMTMELLALGKKLILAFNFNREAAKNGVIINTLKLQEALQIPIVIIEANKGENKEGLLDEIINTAGKEFRNPDYIKGLIKENFEIHHEKSIKIIKEKTAPFYTAEKTSRLTEKIDGIILNRYTAFPIFIAVMFFIFQITIFISEPLISSLHDFFRWIGEAAILLKAPDFLSAFISEGLIGGLGSVLSFIPLIFILFLMIAVLEDSGYLVRAVVLMDPFFQKLGITGRSFISMILGFGCNVPAIMATRTIKDRRERLIAIFTNSYMSCGARLPVYLLFATIFFPKNTGIIIMILYLTGILVAFLATLVLTKLMKSKVENTLIIELPAYRIPTVSNILKHACFHTGEFIKKAGTIIFISIIVIWILANLPLGVEYGSENSLLGMIGHLIAVWFKPLGFGYWKFAVALIFGVVAKEAIISSLGTLFEVGNMDLTTVIPQHLTALGALSLLFFILLYTPCLAALATIKQESGSWKYTLLLPVVTIAIAWVISYLVYNVGLLFGF